MASITIGRKIDIVYCKYLTLLTSYAGKTEYRFGDNGKSGE